MLMNLFLLKRNKPEYDETYALVVAAVDAEDARRVAAEIAGKEKEWLSPDQSTCARVGLADQHVKRGVVLEDIHAS